MSRRRFPRMKIAVLSTRALFIAIFSALLPLAASAQAKPLLFLYAPSVTYSSGGYAVSVTLADVNRDGKLDILVADCGPTSSCYGNGSVGVLLGNGDGTFQPVVTYPSGGNTAESIAVADVNGDGNPDLIVANCGSQFNCSGIGLIGVLLGNGDGTFQPVATYPSGGLYAESVVARDVNGDGKPDLIVANCSGNCSSYGSVGVLLGNGDGTFQPAVTFYSGGMGAESVTVADVNGDGKPDVIVANCSSNSFYCSPGDGDVVVFLGNGDGTFYGGQAYDSGGLRAVSVTVADTNGDGKPDILVANSSSCTVGELLGNGDGTFQPVVTSPGCGLDPLGGPRSVTVSDVNGDGKPDLVLSTNGAGVSLGNGDGTFQPVVTYDTGQGGGFVVVGDVDGDGRPDMVILADGNGGVGVLLNNNGAPPTTTSLVASMNPAPMNQSVTYTATLTPPSGRTVNGAVIFMDGIDYLGTVPLANNHAAFSISYNYLASHSISATYSGELNEAAGSVSGTLTEYITGTSNTTLATSGSPSAIGQPVTFTAKVTSHYGTIPNGELVSFYDGTTLLGSVALAGGSASYTTSALTNKTHTIKATYVGDNTFSPSSATVVQVVKRDATATMLVSNLNPSLYGQEVTWTATVTTSGSVPPTGTVKFAWGTHTIGSAPLNGSGVATLTRSNLSAGSYPVTAEYLGDASNLNSTSPVVNQVVTQATSSATLTSSPNPSASGQAVTFTATITSPTVKPTGPVTFAAGKVVLGTAQLSSGKAKFTTSTLAVGSTTVTATYFGNSNIAESSASVTQTVHP